MYVSKVGDPGFRMRPGHNSVWYRFLYNGCSLAKIPEETDDNDEWNSRLIQSMDRKTIDQNRLAWYHDNVPLYSDSAFDDFDWSVLADEWKALLAQNPD